MHFMMIFCKWLENTSVGTAMRESLWLFPAVETVHLFGIIALVASTGILDLRLLGVLLRGSPVSRLEKQLLPWAWVGFATQIITGLLLFSSEATKCYLNLSFRLKMLMILLAGLNALIFQVTVYSKVRDWDTDAVAPLGARVAGCCSLLLWFGVVTAGRWISYY